VVARFTALATAAVIVLAATGTYAALRAFGSVAELWTTTYGLALLVKLIFFGGLLLFGAYNRWRVAPLLALPAHTPVQVQRLRACVGAEIGLSAIVLLAVGVLTASSPPRTLVTPGVDHHATARVNGVTLDLQIVHGAVGDVYALALRGLPPDAQPSVVLRSSMIGHDMGTLELPLEPVEPGRWGARGSLFVMPGHTAIEAVVLQPGVINDLRYTWTVTPHQPLERDVSPVVLGWGALVVAAVCAIALSQVPGAGWRGALAMRHNPASIGPNRSQKAD
jgi:copper transport protein